MTRSRRGVLIGGLVATGLVLASTGGALAGSFSGTGGPALGATRGVGLGAMLPGNGGKAGMVYGYGARAPWGICGSSSMMGGWIPIPPVGRVLTLTQAQRQVQTCIDRMGNQHLAVDEVMEFQRNFYAIVKDTSTGHGAFEVLVNKLTGAVSLEPGPAMMWNTEYGMGGGMMGYRPPAGPMTVSGGQAARIARQWLARYQPGATVESPDQFPGYYTVHIRRHGTISGMLSVNGYSGQVWYHTWHGAFIRLKEAGAPAGVG